MAGFSRLKSTYPAVREVLGDRAQWVAAAAVGGYAFYVGMFLSQILCGFLGIGG